MTWSLTAVILALLPVAGTLIIMNWVLRDAKRESGLEDALTHQSHAMAPSVPSQTFASHCGQVPSKCLRQKEHSQLHDSSVAFGTDASQATLQQPGTKRQ